MPARSKIVRAAGTYDCKIVHQVRNIVKYHDDDSVDADAVPNAWQKSLFSCKAFSVGKKKHTDFFFSRPLRRFIRRCRFECFQNRIFVLWHLQTILKNSYLEMRKTPIKSRFFGEHLFCCPFVVRSTRLELVREFPHAPQTCASASSATIAFIC